jgi:hypothetical protein
VSLRPYLDPIQGLEQLPALCRELGLTPTWHELELESLRLPGLSDRGRRAAVVGRRDRFFALAVEAGDPLRDAARIARALARRGQPALVAALDPPRRLLGLAVAHADSPAMAIDLARVSTADLARLERGRPSESEGPAAVGARWAEALSGQDLGQRFFVQFKRTLEAFMAALLGSIPRRDRHALALLGLTRVLFLYFVQEKGWLDGRRRFLREELDASLERGREVESDLLRPLFFGTLNRPADQRSRLARRFGRVPFLNGGLFEPHPLERRWSAAFPGAAWRDAFDDLFERYHFTVGAEEGSAGTIGPDMLGRVFEGVMDPDERRSGGAFYTPAALVDELVEAALVQWLAGRCAVSPEESLALLQAPTPTALAVLRDVTVLDPAAGSGAFLLGVLRRLVAARQAGGETRAAATRSVLARNLFGVDLNPAAVRLAELRLWLEVIGAEPEDPAADIAPLPNLDSLIRQGDSLVEPFHAPVAARPAHARRLAALRGQLLQSTGAEKQRLIAALRAVELEAARGAAADAVAAIEARLDDLASAGRSPGLFGERVTTTSNRRAIAALRQERARLRGLLRRLRSAGELPWFHFGSQFGDVVGRGGFDLVVGNPPWVRSEAIGRARRRELKARYRWFRAGRPAEGRAGGAGGAGGPRGYAHLPDLSVAFVERCYELVRPGGVLALLVPAKLATAGYGAVLREELARRSTVLVAADLTARAGSAFDATVYPMALVVRRSPPPSDHRVGWALGTRHSALGGATPSPVPSAERGVPQATLGGAPWILSTSANHALARAAAEHPVLGARFRARLGVKTGCDRAFLDPPRGVEPELIRPAARGRDVRAFRIEPRHAMLWTHDERGAPLERLPAEARRHLARHEAALRRRADYRDGPYWRVFRVDAAIAPHRVIWADLARRLEAAVPSGRRAAGVVPLNTTYVMSLPAADPALRLAVWLNSTPIRTLAKERASVAWSGYARFSGAVIESLPLPDRVLDDAALLALGRDALRLGELDQERADAAAARLLGVPSP